ncbi:MAG TPA: cytochrome P450 [Trebonia sp.]|jgi:cytochrome P450
MRIPSSHENATRLYGPEFAADPAGIYREMRDEYGAVAPVLLDGDVPAWFVLAYREVLHVTGNPQLFGRDSRRWNLRDQVPADWALAPFVAWAPSVLHAEGSEHQRRAGAIGDALDEIDRTELARLCERTADQLIDEFAGDGRADLVRQYAQRIPITVIARLYGIPEDDIPALVSDIEAAGTEGEEAVAAHGRAIGRIGMLIKQRRDQPGAGLPARLIRHPAALSDEELTMDMHMIMVGAQQPTADWIGNTLRLMLTDEGFSLTLQGGRGDAARALTEVLWKDTPIQNLVGRWAVQECDLGGHRIGRGDMLVLGLAAANADPQVQPAFAGDAGVNRAHMSFAHGEHSCPYAAPEIAELMARTAIEVLLDRVPDTELALPASELRWRPSAWMRGLYSLPVAFTPTLLTAQRL